ncbi:MAG: hypothetical protein ACOZE5_10955 [Verrucomicrobiota bacterium]
MPVSSPFPAVPSPLDRLRGELADLAYDLERQGRLDAADVVMQLDARVRELAAEAAAEHAGHPFPHDSHR